jgi:anion-transporting  ArsA/GET3 family ATPase
LPKNLKLKNMFVSRLLFIWIFFFLGSACQSNTADVSSKSNKNELEKIEKSKIIQGDDLVQPVLKEKIPTAEKVVNLQKIEKKYGEQWDFCTCVHKNDSINRAAQLPMNEKQADKFMKRWEEIDTKCKAFLTNPSTTPEERELHAKKVAACLKK